MPQHAQRHSAVSCAKMAERTRMSRRKHKFNQSYSPGWTNVSSWEGTLWEGTLAPRGEHDWTVRLRRRCSLMANYFDHLLLYYCL